jgi:D-alanyl-D-alanine carboxypeptidase
VADLPRGLPLTPRHRFRVASHSKTFTAAGLLLLRERGKLTLDDAIGRYVDGLPAAVAAVTLNQLLSHSAGVVRDGYDSGQWSDRRPFLDEAELRADVSRGLTLPPGTRFKYSNHGYGLLGLALANITGEPYVDWMAREVVAAAGLKETTPDVPLPQGTPLARGHSAKWPLGRRVALPVENPTNGLASATGFVSTAHDLSLFFASLSPLARKSVLSVASRREMQRRQWRDPHGTLERWYGLGSISTHHGEWTGWGHSGGFQGVITRTVSIPEQQLAVSVLTNAADGPSHLWLDGALSVLRAFATHGAPPRRHAAWTGRWWSLWGPMDLLPMGDCVRLANPGLTNPLLDATEIEVLRRSRDGTERGQVALAHGYGHHGEATRLDRDARGRTTAFWLGGNQMLPEARVSQELARRYENGREIEHKNERESGREHKRAPQHPGKASGKRSRVA